MRTVEDREQEYQEWVISQDNICAECYGDLFLIDNVAACGCNQTHQGIVPKKDHAKNKRGGIKMVEENTGRPMTNSLAKYQTRAVLAEAEVTEIVEKLWPGAPALEKYKAIAICKQYQLNPLLGHVFLIPFKKQGGGETFVTVLGIKATRLMVAREVGKYGYLDNTPRAMSDEEQLLRLGKKETDPKRTWAFCKLRDDVGFEYTGFAYYDGQPYGTDKGNSALNMACIRAERKAFDRMAPGKLPSELDVVDERYQPPPEVMVVDGETGQILQDGEAEPTAEPTAEANAEPEKAPRKQPAKATQAAPDATQPPVAPRYALPGENDMGMATTDNLEALKAHGKSHGYDMAEVLKWAESEWGKTRWTDLTKKMVSRLAVMITEANEPPPASPEQAEQDRLLE